MKSNPVSARETPNNRSQAVKQARVKNLDPRDGRDVRAGHDDMSLSLNFEKYKTTFVEYGR